LERTEMINRVILLVEDNPDDVELTLRALQQNKVANPVIVARDGVEALDYIYGRGKHTGRSINALPAIVLLDLKMPKVDGLEVLRAIREDDRTTLLPVVILTSSKEENDIYHGYRLRANSYICKPVDFVQFARAIQQIYHYWLVLNEPPILSLK
jgi:two-component system, response regulator